MERFKGLTTCNGRDSFLRCDGLEREQGPETLVQRRLARIVKKTGRERLELFRGNVDGHCCLDMMAGSLPLMVKTTCRKKLKVGS